MIARNFLIICGVLALSASPLVLAEGAPSCVACHGIDGVAVKPGVPHLNGQLPAYLEHSVEQYRKDARPGRGPAHDPAALDDPQTAEILKTYGAAKAVRPKQDKVDAQLAVRGEVVYQDRCADCHPDNGRESEKDAPLMAAQDLGYMIGQINLFVEGKRKFAYMMSRAFKGVPAADLEAVAHFFASQDQVPPPPKKKKR